MRNRVVVDMQYICSLLAIFYYYYIFRMDLLYPGYAIGITEIETDCFLKMNFKEFTQYIYTCVCIYIHVYNGAEIWTCSSMLYMNWSLAGYTFSICQNPSLKPKHPLPELSLEKIAKTEFTACALLSNDTVMLTSLVDSLPASATPQ